jgi:hypothetical protein
LIKVKNKIHKNKKNADLKHPEILLFNKIENLGKYRHLINKKIKN